MTWTLKKNFEFKISGRLHIPGKKGLSYFSTTTTKNFEFKISGRQHIPGKERKTKLFQFYTFLYFLNLRMCQQQTLRKGGKTFYFFKSKYRSQTSYSWKRVKLEISPMKTLNLNWDFFSTLKLEFQ